MRFFLKILSALFFFNTLVNSELNALDSYSTNYQFSENDSLLFNLFFINNEAYDIRTLSPVKTDFKPGVVSLIEANKSIAVHDQNNWYGIVYYYDLKGEKLGQISLDKGMKISPNYEYVLYLKENDIWGRVIENCQLTEKEYRLTNYGSIKELYFGAWYGWRIVPRVGYDYYHFNIEKAEIKRASDAYYFWPRNPSFKPESSPNDKFHLFFDRNNGTGKALVQDSDSGDDLQVDFTLPILPTSNYYQYPKSLWISNDEFFIFLDTYDSQQKATSQIFRYKFDLNSNSFIQSNGTPITIKDWSTQHFFGNNKPSYFEKIIGFDYRPRCISPGGKYFIYPTVNYNTNIIVIQVQNLESGEINNIQQFWNKDNFPKEWNSLKGTYMGYNGITYEWLTDSTIIYCTSGDILTQGTWIHDVKTNTRIKLISFITQKIWIFRESGLVLYKANDKLYRMKIDGSQSIEFKPESYKGNSNIEKFFSLK